jgi:hypothetical protein
MEVDIPCPECYCCIIKNKEYVWTFNYRYGENAVLLSATVPMRVCNNCNFEWFDKEAFRLRDKAVKACRKKLNSL